MSKTIERLTAEIHALAETEKLELVDAILKDLDRPNPEIDRIWGEEARKRWSAYKAGSVTSVDYETVMAKYRKP